MTKMEVFWPILLTFYVGRAHCRGVPYSDFDPDSDAIESDPGLDDPWLADFDGGRNSQRYVDYLDGMQADAPSSAGGGDDKKSYQRLQEWVCPPPPPANSKPPAHFCKMSQCTSDNECKGHKQKCCFNGCVQACLNTLPPPPLVDWIKEPPRRLLAGNSWLVGGPESLPEGDSCSTDFDPAVEDALLCSRGYICHILYPGDKEKGIPNRGRCMKEDNHDAGLENKHRFRLATSQRSEDQDDNVCVFENAIFVNGTRFMYQNHECECLKNTITCTVGEDTLH